MDELEERLKALPLEELLGMITPDRTLRELKAIKEVAELNILGTEARKRIRTILLGMGLIERTAHGLTDTGASMLLDRDMRFNGLVN